ncbi:MAG: hypothetical protein HLUCCA08_12300 [Rhodobacteraceae bacterium HLUCCA08]|nr:MAG: hypothetical protein HLUCCA08_12300 [Rhodobacteraceae bacterium HLUCCA08]
MAVDYRVFRDIGTVLVTYSGKATVPDTLEAFERYRADPDFEIGQKHLFDVRAVTRCDAGFEEYFGMQARLVEVYGLTENDQLIAFLIDSPAGRDMAVMSQKSWDHLSSVVITIHDSEPEALAALGLRERSLEALRQHMM